MDTIDNAHAVDVDPLSAFPAESELERKTNHDRTNQLALDGTSSEIITALFSALYDLQLEVHSLKAALTETREIARSARKQADTAVTAVSDVESRVKSLRRTPRIGSLAIATRAREMFDGGALRTRFEKLRSQGVRWFQLFCQWCGASWRGLVDAASVMLKTARARRL